MWVSSLSISNLFLIDLFLVANIDLLLTLLLQITNKHNQKPTDMFNKQDVTVYLTYIKILKDLNILNFRLYIPEVIFKVLEISDTN